MANDKENKEEVRKFDEEYSKALLGAIFAGVILIMLSLPILFAVIGFSVRCFRWAAGP